LWGDIVLKQKTAFAAILVLVLVPLASRAGRKQLPSGLQRAGVISAILYNTNLVRQSNPAVRVDNGTELAWTDTLLTDGNGRVLVRLDDGSKLSIGTDSELQIVAHDPQLHRTVVQLTSGRLRAQLNDLPNGATFEVRTPDAVATVVGTDFGVDASVPGQVKFICMTGTVRISTPSSADTQECEAGYTLTIRNGKPSRDFPADDRLMAVWRNITDPDEPPPYYPIP
jgi:ferric-dicitrate binding protein FerR (iron transport regulator)